MRDPASTLRAHQLPVTVQRLAVLKAVSAHPHGTADDLAESVRFQCLDVRLTEVNPAKVI